MTELLSPAPLLSLLEQINQELGVLKTITPHSDVTGAVARLRDHLMAAVEEARRADHWISVEQAQRITGRPASTLTRLCRLDGRAIGAKKVGRAWTIHLPTLQRFLTQHMSQAPQAARHAAA